MSEHREPAYSSCRDAENNLRQFVIDWRDCVIDRDTVANAMLEAISTLATEIERLRDRAVCSGCGSDVDEGGVCHYAGCDDGEMIPASELPLALREMRDRRDEWRQEAMSL